MSLKAYNKQSRRLRLQPTFKNIIVRTSLGPFLSGRLEKRIPIFTQK